MDAMTAVPMPRSRLLRAYAQEARAEILRYLREPAFLRQFKAQPGEYFELDAPIALLSTTADEPLDQAPARAVRVTTAGIIHHEGMWTGNNR